MLVLYKKKRFLFFSKGASSFSFYLVGIGRSEIGHENKSTDLKVEDLGGVATIERTLAAAELRHENNYRLSERNTLRNA